MSPRPFLMRLQSIRGLAALMVGAAHAVEALKFPVGRQYEQRIALNLAYGEGAVIVFFVLSGFVLSLTMDRDSEWNWRSCWQFVHRRLLRLYPAIFFCTLVYFVVGEVGPMPNASTMLGKLTRPTLSMWELLQNFLLLKTNLVGVAWSLQPELLFSLFLPISYLWTSRFPFGHFVVFGLLLVIYHLFPLNSTFHFSYLFIFYMGVVSYFYRTNLAAVYRLIPKQLACFLFLLCAAVFFSTLHFGHHLDLLALVATFVISWVAFDISPMVFSFLDAKALIELGNISYSFYLLHPLCLGLSAILLLSFVPDSEVLAHMWLVIFALWTASTAIAIPVAVLSFRISERPFTSTGKRRPSTMVKA